MSRAFAAGFAASAAIHAAVLAALWQGPSGGQPPPETGSHGIALVWEERGRAADEAPFAPGGATEAPMLEPEDGPQPPVTEETTSVVSAAEPIPAPLTSLPLPPLPPSRPAPTRRSEARATAATEPTAAPPSAMGEGAWASTAAGGNSGVFTPAGIGTRQDPTYPWEARRNRWQGTVLLAVTVSPSGRPIAIDIARSSGYGVLDEAAVEAVRQWRFVPARRNGVAVEDRVAVPITFRLRD